MIALAIVLASVSVVAAHAATARRAGAQPAATLTVEAQSCADDGRVTVTFAWIPGEAGEQWLDLTLFNNGFAPGTFLGAGPIVWGEGRFTWPGLLAGTTHYARMNTLTASGWHPSATLAFNTPRCSAAASAPIVSLACSDAMPGRVTMTAGWVPGNPGSEWVDLSLFNNGFQAGTFLGAGPLASGTGSIVWQGLMPDAVHYVRVNTLTSSGWRPSGTTQFRTPRCTAPERPIVTLTFDDGGAYLVTILDILEAMDVRGIFFPTGRWAELHPSMLQRMIVEGHEVGNHTYSHTNLTVLSDAQVRAEVAGGDVGTVNLFRPPYAILDARTRAIVEEMGFVVYSWDIDPMDWKKTHPGAEYEITDEVVRQAFPGAIVLLHTQSPRTPYALPMIIEQLRAMGYEVTW